MSREKRTKKSRFSFLRSELFDSETINVIKSSWEGASNFHSFLSKINVSFIHYPFTVCIIKDFFENIDFLKSVVSELEHIIFNPKDNDLYRFSQSDDLQNLRDYKNISQLYDIFCTEVHSWISSIYGKEELKEDISATFSSYQFGDHNMMNLKSNARFSDRLLCHDDKCEDRHIAFVLYLVENWKEEFGGNLQLFASDANKYPQKVVETVVPQFNTIILFEVTSVSFHQVSEVLTKNNRLSLNGWFHSKNKKAVDNNCDIFENSSNVANENDYNLNHYFLPNYLEYGNQVQIRTRFVNDSEIQLDEFLIPTFLEEIIADLGSTKIKWDIIGPANIRRYEVAECTSLSPALRTLKDILESKCWLSCLKSITGLDLAPSRSSDMSIWNCGNEPTCNIEIQRWTPGCYSLIHDRDPDIHIKALDIFLRFPFENHEQECSILMDDENTPETGHIIYIDKDSKDEECLLHIGYKMNSLALVYRDTKTLRFTKYMDSTSEPFYQIACIYRPWSPPADQPRLKHCDSDSASESSEMDPEMVHCSEIEGIFFLQEENL